MAEFSADIEAYQGGFATKAEHAGLAKQLVLLIKRHKGIFTTAAAAWLLITVLAVWFVINLRTEKRRAIAGETSARAAEAGAVVRNESRQGRGDVVRRMFADIEADLYVLGDGHDT